MIEPEHSSPEQVESSRPAEETMPRGRTSLANIGKLPLSDPSVSVPAVSAKDGAARATRMAAVARAVFMGHSFGWRLHQEEIAAAAPAVTHERCRSMLCLHLYFLRRM